LVSVTSPAAVSPGFRLDIETIGTPSFEFSITTSPLWATTSSRGAASLASGGPTRAARATASAAKMRSVRIEALNQVRGQRRAAAERLGVVTGHRRGAHHRDAGVVAGGVVGLDDHGVALKADAGAGAIVSAVAGVGAARDADPREGGRSREGIARRRASCRSVHAGAHCSRRARRFRARRVEVKDVTGPHAAPHTRARRRGALAVSAFAALLAVMLPAAASAGPLAPVTSRLATTGHDSELVKAIPIATQQYANERVAMSLGPEELGQIQNGDRLWASGEVQVSTTCVQKGPRCIGRRYDFNPWITARLVLAASPSPIAPGIPLSGEVTVHCKQRRPNRNHHCPLVLPNLETSVVDTASLPCPANGCYANLVIGAWAKKARRGNRVVVGGDLPDGGVIQDKGRLNVVVAPSVALPPIESTSAALVNATVPVADEQRHTRRVIHSVEIGGARGGDVLAFDTAYLVAIDHLFFNTFIGSRVVIADSPTSTKPSELAKEIVQFKGHGTESNGFNCTQGRSGYRSPCTVAKAGAIRIKRDAVDERGQPVPLYVNAVSAVAPKLSVDAKPDDFVTVSPLNGLRVLRFPAA
jgi:hypothetical protein